MADLDNHSKRASGLQIFRSWQATPPFPTLVIGDIDQADRQHLAWCYSGILASSGVTGSLFRQEELNGISVGGPFFSNPIG